MGVVVVVPTYKEEGNVGPLISRIQSLASKLGNNVAVLIVNDVGSQVCQKLTTLSKYEFEDGNLVLLLNCKGKRGLGSAYKLGFRYALDNLEPTTLIQMDGDLQHPPEKILELVKLIERGYDVAIASRYVKGSVNQGMNWGREIFSRSTNLFVSRFLGLGVSDATSGFRALSKKAVESIVSDGISATGFAFQFETLSMLKRKGMRIREMPFHFAPRVKGKSKLLLSNPFDFIRSIFLSKVRHSLHWV